LCEIFLQIVWNLIYLYDIRITNHTHLTKNVMDYKAHTFQIIGKGKFHPSRSACGRKAMRNSKGTFTTSTKHFLELLAEDQNLVCQKCLEKLKA